MVYTQSGRETTHPQNEHNPDIGSSKRREYQKDRTNAACAHLCVGWKRADFSRAESRKTATPGTRDPGQKVQGGVTNLHSIVTVVKKDIMCIS